MHEYAQVACVLTVGVLILALGFRKPLVALLGRLVEVKAGGGGALFAPDADTAQDVQGQRAQAKIATVPLPEPTPDPVGRMPEPDLTLDGVIAKLRPLFEQGVSQDPREREAWLLHYLAGERLRWHHEVTYRTIFGSQIKLIERLNTHGPMSELQAGEFYQTAREAFPDFYRNFIFKAWVGYLVQREMLEVFPHEGMEWVRLTPYGKHFLHYMVGTGLPSERFA